ncbi:MAG TPA: threonine dehydratase [Candidatus Didemnitutus sp.]|nr:threonine dehydratase [Candidatus Didemnitutus sp.]
MTGLPTLAEIDALTPFIDGLVPPTPQYSWPQLNARTGCELWVKHENQTAIGSFKIRGALAYLAREQKRSPAFRCVVAATRGNFGQAVAYAARAQGLAAIIVVPFGNSPMKNAAMRALGAELIEAGDDFQAALDVAEKLARERGAHYVPSFHRDLVLGNAVSSLRFLRTAPRLEAVYVPIGLGSGVCAMVAARDALGLPMKVIGVAAAAAPAISLSVAAREIRPHPANTRIADGMACSTPNPEAFAQILAGVDRIVTVTDDEIEAAIRAYFTDARATAEGAAAAGLAAVLQDKAAVAGRRIGVVLSGRNIDDGAWTRIVGTE